jgi:hypothetical protein
MNASAKKGMAMRAGQERSVIGPERGEAANRGYVPASPHGHITPPPVILNQPSSVVPPKVPASNVKS